MALILAHMTQDEARRAADEGRMVILPTGATESHGPHMPLDTDTHQADYMARCLAERVEAVVAPAVPYAISKTFEHFPGTVALSIPTYQQLVYEIGAALIGQGFKHLLILNGNRPNATSNDAVARRLIDDLDARHAFMVTAVSYWEPGAARVHALRRSGTGGMGHGGEFETSFQLATRPELVHMDRLEGVAPPLVRWDLVAPMEPVRTYARRPRPDAGHPSIFGDPRPATAEQGRAFIEATLDALVALVRDLGAAYEARR